MCFRRTEIQEHFFLKYFLFLLVSCYVSSSSFFATFSVIQCMLIDLNVLAQALIVEVK